LLEASGRCPPEDVGGPWGYEEYLTALADADDDRHAELLRWRGPFDPTAVDVKAIEKALAKLAPRKSKKPSTEKKP
jgi:hypothetical protein